MMPEATSLITSAFVEAVNQLTTYLGIGITAAISALLLDYQAARRFEAELRSVSGKAKSEDAEVLSQPPAEKAVTVPGVSVEVVPNTAKWLLVGAYVAAGILAYTTALSALSASQALHEQPDLVRAMCLQPGIATSPRWLRLFACLLPVGLMSLVMWRIYTRVKMVYPTEGSARYMMPLVAAIPYLALALTLWKLPC
jgi:hypothetical protein